MALRGRPLTSHEVIVETIAATTTRTGLTVTAELDTAEYPKGIKISDRQMREPDKSGALPRHIPRRMELRAHLRQPTERVIFKTV